MTSSYWLSEERPDFLDRASRPAGPVDVAIVGGGVTGCACALVLAALAIEPAGADQLIRDTGLDAPAIATALAELELAGAVAEADGLYRGVRLPG